MPSTAGKERIANFLNVIGRGIGEVGTRRGAREMQAMMDAREESRIRLAADLRMTQFDAETTARREELADTQEFQTGLHRLDAETRSTAAELKYTQDETRAKADREHREKLAKLNLEMQEGVLNANNVNQARSSHATTLARLDDLSQTEVSRFNEIADMLAKSEVFDPAEIAKLEGDQERIGARMSQLEDTKNSFEHMHRVALRGLGEPTYVEMDDFQIAASVYGPEKAELLMQQAGMTPDGAPPPGPQGDPGAPPLQGGGGLPGPRAGAPLGEGALASMAGGGGLTAPPAPAPQPQPTAAPQTTAGAIESTAADQAQPQPTNELIPAQPERQRGAVGQGIVDFTNAIGSAVGGQMAQASAKRVQDAVRNKKTPGPRDVKAADGLSNDQLVAEGYSAEEIKELRALAQQMSTR